MYYEWLIVSYAYNIRNGYKEVWRSIQKALFIELIGLDFNDTAWLRALNDKFRVKRW